MPAPASQPSTAASAKPPRFRGRRPLLWRLTFWAIALFLVVELLLRLVLGLGHPVLFVADPACAYLPAPNQKIHRFFSHNEINADNMRSPPVQRPKPAGEFRVLFIGDSVTYGTTRIDQSQIFTSILARDLPRQLGRPVEVLNASAGGWAVGNELGYLRSRGTFDADLVVFVVNTMDMTQEFCDGHPAPDDLVIPSRNPPLATWELWNRYLRPRLFHINVADRGSATTSNGDAEDLARCAQTTAWLDEARQICQRAGTSFAVVYSPVVGPGRHAPAFTEPWTNMLNAWAAKADVPLLDLTSAFAAAPPEEVYQDNIHLAAKGDALAAEAIERWPVVTAHAAGASPTNTTATTVGAASR